MHIRPEKGTEIGGAQDRENQGEYRHWNNTGEAHKDHRDINYY
jgi:hypothetical protein